MKIIKGDTLEKQMEHVDVILKRFSRKLRKTTTGIITPYSISGYVQSPAECGGLVLKYMFPINGKVILGTLYVEGMPRAGVDIYATVQFEDMHKSESFFTKRQSVMIKPDLDIVAGSRLTIRAVAKGEDQVSGVWASFLWVPEIRDTVIKQFLIDELDRIGEEDALSEEV